MTVPIPLFFFFFFNDTATTEIYTLSLHDALPISERGEGRQRGQSARAQSRRDEGGRDELRGRQGHDRPHARDAREDRRSEEHTSELQSPCNLVCRLLLEKKKKNQIQPTLASATHA